MYQSKHPVLKALFIFITEKTESLLIVHNTAGRIVFDSRISRMVFRYYTRFDEFFFLLGKASAKRAENSIWREESCLALGAT
jgi:hypothetical protein